jgi:hypothetical protein
MTLTNQNDIHDEIKGSLNSGNACYHSVYSSLLSCVLSKSLLMKKKKIAIVPVVLYGCETWSLMREEHMKRHFRNFLM